MPTTFLKATLKDGTVVVGEFSRMARVQRYVTRVMQGVQPFNAWQVVSRSHPASGEEVLYRTRTMYNGRDILSICEVDVTSVPVIQMQRGTYGVWTAPADVDNAVEGTDYPVHRDPENGRRYVVLRVETPDCDETRHYLDPANEAPTAAVPLEGPGDADDDDE